MKKFVFHLTAVVILFCLVLSACSGSKNPDQAKEGNKTSTEQAADAIKEYRGKHKEQARAAQQMGEERTNAIDEALKQK